MLRGLRSTRRKDQSPVFKYHRRVSKPDAARADLLSRATKTSPQRPFSNTISFYLQRTSREWRLPFWTVDWWVQLPLAIMTATQPMKGTVLENELGSSVGHSPLWSTQAVIDHPGAVVNAHLAYIRAGAKVIETATFVAARLRAVIGRALTMNQIPGGCLQPHGGRSVRKGSTKDNAESG